MSILPFLLHCFSCFMHYFMFFWVKFSDYAYLGFFSNLILWIWSMGFVATMIYSWSMLVNLEIWRFVKILKILKLVLNSNWGFCLLWLQLMKLACWIDVIDHYFLKSILYDDQLVNFYKLIKWFFKFFGGFC